MFLPTGSDHCDDRKQPAVKYNEFESISGSPETLRNFERIICKTVFLGSQTKLLVFNDSLENTPDTVPPSKLVL
jgi:hypothetical protein